MARQQAELKQTHQSLARRAREFESRLGVMKDLEVDLRGLIDLAKNVDGDKAKVAELRNEITRVENELAGEIVRLNSTISRIEVSFTSSSTLIIFAFLCQSSSCRFRIDMTSLTRTYPALS